MHRFVWDLRYTRPPALSYHYSIAALWHDRTPLEPRGMIVLPGVYSVTLKAGGSEYTQQLKIKEDPRIHGSKLDLQKQFNFARLIDANLDKIISVRTEIENILKEDKDRISPPLKDSLSALADGRKDSFSQVSNIYADLITAVQSSDAEPTQGQHDVFNHYKSKSDELFIKWERLKKFAENDK